MARPPSLEKGAAEAVEAIFALKKRMKWTDEALAKRIDANQSSVHRALHRVPPAWTPTLQKLSDYAIIMRSGPRRKQTAIDSAPSNVLARTVMDAWDGTTSGLDWLVRLLRLVAERRRRSKEG
jgi:hypothetical protein